MGKTTMANYDVHRRLETYETSHKRDFVYRPIFSTPELRPKTSVRIYKNSYALDDPVGTTLYSEDFCWRPVAKTACIRSATASGHRRNNPHPSQAFMVWGFSPNQMKSLSDGKPLNEQDIQNALSAQYRSTYRVDFLGLPQGMMKNHIICAPSNRSHADNYCTQTEMRHNYCKPILKAGLLVKNSRYGCNKLHGVAARGIVPTVVHKDMNNQRYSKQQTTYNKHFGSQHTDVSSVFSSIQPQMFQQFCEHLASETEQRDAKTLLRTASPSAQELRMKKSGVFLHPPPTLERMSAWPGPL
ncbi:testis-expressed protein 26-like [Triplophysa rosa]|uniref:Testis-expressed protein 26 n=1 Tax=Triplophysa rosa TaxID=992332 RepID=A0A9W7WKR4_TRIRA|nr:testis-expressed protein 26-like [Triplophysa rosa]KAI7801018.1 hypothetical protein IRJ41_018237 [Triplophysa rosa]